MSESLAKSLEDPLETMQKWLEYFEFDDEIVVLRLDASIEPACATILLQHETKKLLAHEESHYVPNERRGFDHERDTMPFMTWGTWWIADTTSGTYAKRDFLEEDEGSIQGIVYALDALRATVPDEREWYETYIKSLVTGDSLYGNILERSNPIDQDLLKVINIDELVISESKTP